MLTSDCVFNSIRVALAELFVTFQTIPLLSGFCPLIPFLYSSYFFLGGRGFNWILVMPLFKVRLGALSIASKLSL